MHGADHAVQSKIHGPVAPEGPVRSAEASLRSASERYAGLRLRTQVVLIVDGPEIQIKSAEVPGEKCILMQFGSGSFVEGRGESQTKSQRTQVIDIRNRPPAPSQVVGKQKMSLAPSLRNQNAVWPG